MKAILPFLLVIFLISCAEKGEQSTKPTTPEPTTFDIDGYWVMTWSDFNFNEALSNYDCPDGEMMAMYKPMALGEHFQIKGDSIAFYRYPYQYYGTFKYELVNDSLFLDNEHYFLEQRTKDSLIFTFNENVFSSACPIRSEGYYERFVPDSAVIKQLMKDSLSFDHLTDQWWHIVRTETFNDGSGPYFFDIPEGTPDSLFITSDMIQYNGKQPTIDLELDDRPIILTFQEPYKYAFTLSADYTMQTKDGTTDTINYSLQYRMFRDITYEEEMKYLSEE